MRIAVRQVMFLEVKRTEDLDEALLAVQRSLQEAFCFDSKSRPPAAEKYEVSLGRMGEFSIAALDDEGFPGQGQKWCERGWNGEKRKGAKASRKTRS